MSSYCARRLLWPGIGMMALLSACGQTGPLYLPPEEEQAHQAADNPPQGDEAVMGVNRDSDTGPGAAEETGSERDRRKTETP